MTTNQKEAITRTIAVTVKGKMEKAGTRGPYLAVQVLRHGMEYPETYNCWDPKQLEQVKANDQVNLILHRDNVKANKEDDGKIGSYWWSIAGLAENPPKATDSPKASSQNGTAVPATYEETQARGYDLGMAFNKAVDIVIAEANGNPINTLNIRQWRDALLLDVILTAPAPAHYCYEHETERLHSAKTGKWGHIVPDAEPCVEKNLTTL